MCFTLSLAADVFFSFSLRFVWRPQRPGTPTRRVRFQHHSPSASQDLPGVGVGSPTGCHTHHLRTGGHRLTSPLVLQTTKRERRRYMHLHARHTLVIFC